MPQRLYPDNILSKCFMHDCNDVKYNIRFKDLEDCHGICGVEQEGGLST